MRPYIIINAAMSIDGKIALATRQQTRLSSEEDMKRVHHLRREVDGILVGIGTVLADNPKLTVKYFHTEKPPKRIVVDSKLRIPEGSELLKPYAPTIIATTENSPQRSFPEHVEVIRCGSEYVDLKKLMEILYSKGIRKILVEGGGKIINSFIKLGLVDELSVYISPVVIGGGAPTLCDGEGAKKYEEMIRFEIIEYKRMGEGLLIRFRPVR